VSSQSSTQIDGCTGHLPRPPPLLVPTCGFKIFFLELRFLYLFIYVPRVLPFRAVLSLRIIVGLEVKVDWSTLFRTLVTPPCSSGPLWVPLLFSRFFARYVFSRPDPSRMFESLLPHSLLAFGNLYWIIKAFRSRPLINSFPELHFLRLLFWLLDYTQPPSFVVHFSPFPVPQM